MVSISLLKRDNGDGYTWSMGGARWAFFALFIVFVLFVLLYTFKVNKRRGLKGIAPVRGTAWMTPPTYSHSQQQYNQPRHDNYVPTYTAEANDLDAGFYDADGTFHPNPNYNSDNLPPKRPIVTDETGNTLSEPTTAHTHTPNFTGSDHNANFQRDFGQIYGSGPHPVSDGHDVELDDIYRRPMGPPPKTTTITTTEEVHDSGEGSSSHSDLPDYSPPPNPPASHIKN